MADTTHFDVPRYVELQGELFAFIELYRPDQLVIDFERIRYCSTALINGVLRARRRLDDIGGTMKLCGMCESVRDAFRGLNLDGTVFQIYDTLDEALASFD